MVEVFPHSTREALSNANSPHIPHVTTEAAALVRGFRDSDRVHQVEGGLILVVVVRVLVAGTELGRVFV